MQNFVTIIEKNIAILTLLLFLLCILELIFIMAINSKFLKLSKMYNKAIKALDKGDILDVFSQVVTSNEEFKSKLDKFRMELSMIDKDVKTSIKKVGIVRYNAFNDVGSDLSFSIALLDSNDNGVVLSGIYGRNDTATFAKPIEKGQSNYPLSAEEIQAIERAKKKAL